MNEDIVGAARARFSGTYAEARQKFRDHVLGQAQWTHDEYWQRLLGDRHVYVCLEFGTYEPERGRRVLRDDHWLHAYGKLDSRSDAAMRIRRAVRDHYYPEALDWKEMVLCRSRQVQRQILEGLRRFG
jgi:Protein of unknown function (DUF2817)